MHATEQPLLIAVHSFHVAMRIIEMPRDSFGDGDERCRQWHCKQGQADRFALIDEPLRHMFWMPKPNPTPRAPISARREAYSR